MKPLIVIRSSDADFCLLVRHILEGDGFKTALAASDEQALMLVGSRDTDAIILDCQSSVSSAISLCESLKLSPGVADLKIIALVRPDVADRYTELLAAGVDEGFVRPLEPRKFLQVLRQLVRSRLTVNGSRPPFQASLVHGDICLDPSRRRVWRCGHEIALGPIEFRLLCRLLEEPGRALSRDELIASAWQRKVFVDHRTVNVHIGRLRKALKAAAPRDPIRTIREIGYGLAASNEDAGVSGGGDCR
ncbi:response regulator transcription factor [Rhizobium sp. BK251]|uniref:response regulator transcription factor n=1 Tax=Rhizobium sp. BK251 TaxID=2512125 RepID=UPI0010F4117F|nr:response regulator transcription factor [Rhizobium sp. BK251]TCL63645.1 two-component system phosphate regulon response regulator PhoB [Rhizobium sp. BK251]